MSRMMDLDAALKSLRAEHAEIEAEAERHEAAVQRLRQEAAHLLTLINVAESRFVEFVEPAAPRLPAAVLTVVPDPRTRVEPKTTVSGSPHPPALRSRIQEQILEAMASEPDREWTPVDLATVTGLERSTVRSNLRKLNGAALIRSVGYGRYCVEVPQAV